MHFCRMYIHDIPDDNKPGIYQNTSLFVWPSLPEVAGDATVLVDPHDVPGMLRAVCIVLSDEKLHDIIISLQLFRCPIT